MTIAARYGLLLQELGMKELCMIEAEESVF